MDEGIAQIPFLIVGSNPQNPLRAAGACPGGSDCENRSIHGRTRATQQPVMFLSPHGGEIGTARFFRRQHHVPDNARGRRSPMITEICVKVTHRDSP